MTISISSLKAARAAMSQGRYVYDVDHGTVEAPEAGPNQFLGKTICEMYISNALHNGAGIVATHNAFDVYAEVVEAALAHRDAEIIHSQNVATMHTALSQRAYNAAAAQSGNSMVATRQTWADLCAALAKVKP